MSQELDSGTLTLLILIGYWCWRLSRSIGDQPPADLKVNKAGRSAPGLLVSKPAASAPAITEDATWGQPCEPGSAVAEALTAIRVADRTFDAAHFLRGAVAAYEAVLAAFTEADLSVLADLTSADVYEPFAAAIVERQAQEDRLEWTLLRIGAAKIVDAALDGLSVSITVRFSSQFITSRRSDPDDPVGETHSSVLDTTDDWTFARELLLRDPNWKLVATGPA